MEVHKHWEVMFWTEEMAYELVSTQFSEFLPIWNSYDMEVENSKPSSEIALDIAYAVSLKQVSQGQLSI